MEGVVASLRQRAVHGDQVLHPRDLGAQHDPVVGEPHLLGEPGRGQGTLHHGGEGHRVRIGRDLAGRVLVHHAGEEVLVQGTPVHADPNRASVLDRTPDDRGEVLVPPAAPHVARIDPVLGQGLGALRVLWKENVAVEVEVPDERDVDPPLPQSLRDVRNRGGRLGGVDGDPDQLAPRPGESGHLLDRGLHIGRVRVRHRLHDHRMPAADGHVSHANRDGLASGPVGGTRHRGWIEDLGGVGRRSGLGGRHGSRAVRVTERPESGRRPHREPRGVIVPEGGIPFQSARGRGSP